MYKFTNEEVSVLEKVFRSTAFQNLIGAEDWDLSEAEEMILWNMIQKREP